MTCVEHLTEQLDLLGYDFVQVTVDVEPLISFAQGPHAVHIEGVEYVVVPKGWIEEQQQILARKHRFRS